MQAPSPQPKPNKITFDDLQQIAKDLGLQAGQGKDTQVKFLLKMVEGGYHAALDTNPNKHGTGIDDATKLAELYVKARQGAVVFDAKADNQRKLISCLRTGIKLGSWPKGGQGEPLATVNNLMTKRQKLRQNPAEAKKLDDAANTLLKYARAQLKQDQLIQDNELADFCYREQPGLKTAEQILEGMVKQLDKLISGAAASNTVQDNDPSIVAARHSLRQRLSAIATARGKSQPGGRVGATP